VGSDLPPPAGVRARAARLGSSLGDERGMSLVLALTAMVVLGIIGIAITTYTTSAQRNASLGGAAQKAYALAEAGANSGAAVLAADSHPETWATHPTAASPSTLTYDVGTVSWWASCLTTTGTSCTRWRITARSRVTNPTLVTDAPVTRTVSLQERVVMQPGGTAWAYLYSRNDMNVSGNVFVTQPLYVSGDLTMTGGAEIGLSASPATVVGNLSMQGGNYFGLPATATLAAATTATATTLSVTSTAGLPSFGEVKIDSEIIRYNGIGGSALTGVTRGYGRTTAAAHAAGAVVDGRLASVHIAGACNSGGASGTACDAAHRVYGATVDHTVTSIPVPDASASIATWYAQAAPGPLNPCTSVTGSGVPLFDKAGSTTLNSDGPTADLTPGSTYDCKVIQGGVTTGELAWNNSTKVLTAAGTIFFDGDVKVSQALVFNAGSPGATIWTSGKITMSGGKDFCGLAKAGGGCDFDNWNPQTNEIALVSSKPPAGATYTTTNGIDISGGTQVQGLFYVDGLYNGSGGSQVQGSVIADSITLSGGTGTPSPGVIDLPDGTPGTRSLANDSGSYSG
jgi:Tfp pilus assembly protein PilX